MRSTHRHLTGLRRRGGIRRIGVAGLLLPLLSGACIPYAVGTTARPVPEGQDTKTLSIFAMPKMGRIDSTKDVSAIAMDAEWRWGTTDHSDVGVRISNASGIIVNTKQLLSDPRSMGTQVAIIPGAGFVNMGSHAYFELTLVASAAEDTSSVKATHFVPGFVPYGGVRAMQVAPIQEDAVHDKPTIGAFIGTRIGSRDYGLSPEIGVFYDHSALGLRHSDIVIVPSVSVHGDRLIDGIGELIGMTGIFGPGRRRHAEAPIVPTPAARHPTVLQEPAVSLPNAKTPTVAVPRGPRRVRPIKDKTD